MTEVPKQTGLALATITTVGATVAVITIVIALDVAVAGEAQGAFEVITHVIISPFIKATFV